MRLVLLLSLACGSCASTNMMSKEALRHEHRAERFAATGQPDRAAAEREKAESLRAQIDLHFDTPTRQHFNWIGM